MNECVCGRIISANKLYCRECGEEVVSSLQQAVFKTEQGEE